ncbi:MAG TPA: TIGR01621 family pseudouridine synthase [Marinobacter sp.]|nr:TIGR01621 family pseudouridine synthase [Marinobacter sp.]
MYDLIWRSDAAIVVYKHPGVSFHSEDGHAGLFETVRQREGFESLYPVHRLDKVTSGLLVMARTSEANRALCEQFARRQCEKFYLALGAAKPRKKQGTVSGDMVPARRGAWRLTRGSDNPAHTQFFSHSVAPGLRLFVVRPSTGKTHQIRVALKSLGSPIIGDSLYGGGAADRCYLHAWSLGFTLDGEFRRFTEAPRQGELFLHESTRAMVQSQATPWEQPWPVI